MNSVRIAVEANQPLERRHKIACRDVTFVTELLKHFPKFTKATDKGVYAFDEDLLSCTPVGVDRVYVPFSFDKQHWVALCLDLADWNIYVIDCFSSLWREPKQKTALQPLAEMFPYIMRLASTKVAKKKVVYNQLAIQREKDIPQAVFGRHSGVMAARLIEAHADGGVVACKQVKVNDVFAAALKYIVVAYELAHGPI